MTALVCFFGEHKIAKRCSVYCNANSKPSSKRANILFPFSTSIVSIFWGMDRRSTTKSMLMLFISWQLEMNGLLCLIDLTVDSYTDKTIPLGLCQSLPILTFSSNNNRKTKSMMLWPWYNSTIDATIFCKLWWTRGVLQSGQWGVPSLAMNSLKLVEISVIVPTVDRGFRLTVFDQYKSSETNLWSSPRPLLHSVPRIVEHRVIMTE